MPLGEEEIANRFGFHKATPTTAPQHEVVRRNFKAFAHFLDDMLPDGRAKSVAFTALDEASMWSNKAISEQAPLVDERPFVEGEAVQASRDAQGVSSGDAGFDRQYELLKEGASPFAEPKPFSNPV